MIVIIYQYIFRYSLSNVILVINSHLIIHMKYATLKIE